MEYTTFQKREIINGESAKARAGLVELERRLAAALAADGPVKKTYLAEKAALAAAKTDPNEAARKAELAEALQEINDLRGRMDKAKARYNALLVLAKDAKQSAMSPAAYNEAIATLAASKDNVRFAKQALSAGRKLAQEIFRQTRLFADGNPHDENPILWVS